jgi:hypothetical protein
MVCMNPPSDMLYNDLKPDLLRAMVFLDQCFRVAIISPLLESHTSRTHQSDVVRSENTKRLPIHHDSTSISVSRPYVLVRITPRYGETPMIF